MGVKLDFARPYLPKIFPFPFASFSRFTHRVRRGKMLLLQRTDIRTLLLVCLTLVIPVPGAVGQCYYPDGTIPTDYNYVPCTGSGFSSCCIPSEGDVCMSNGLCYYQSGQYLFRGACSDQTWKDNSCAKFCNQSTFPSLLVANIVYSQRTPKQSTPTPGPF